MKHKSDSDEAVFPADIILGENHADTEFDEAVTSEISISSINIAPVTGDNTEHEAYDGAEAYSDHAVAEPPTVDDEALEPGFFLRDRFEIVALVHSGGMGHVYKAIDKRRHVGGSEQIHVAIKMIRRSIASRLDANLALEREAAKTQYLAHPNIVNVFDFDQHGDQFYVVMEWLEGESLNTLLRRTSGQRLEPQFAWRIVEGLAAGLQHAHANNVVHADINPSNIFITETQEIKLLDFGVARYANDPANNADDSTVWATRTYASPEVLSGSPPSFEDDIFSLGCVAYRLMSGVHPFSGLSSVDARDVAAEVPGIAGISESHWRTLSRALSFDRRERPSSASDFITDASAGPKPGFAWGVFGRPVPLWLSAAAIAAAVIVAGFWWSSQSRVESDASAGTEAPLVDIGPAVSPEAARLSSELAALLSRAATATDEARLVAPAGDSARDLYREALARDPSNVPALRGLRAISDVYVQQTTMAIRDGDFATAMEALAVAMETSPENPSIAIVNELVLAQGDSQLAKAQLAAADGDTDRALEMLSEAERYGTINIAAIDVARGQITQAVEERQFLDALATADGHLSAGRLVAPAGNNAQALLLELREQHGNDSQLNASMERLGERLLTRAAFATAAGDFGEASEMLGATEALGVLEKDVAAAQLSLQRVVSAQPAPAESASVVDAAQVAAGEPAPMLEAVQRAQATGSDVVTPPVALAVAQASPTTTDDTSAGAPAAMSSTNVTSSAGSADIDEAPRLRTITLADLAIEKYVAPGFPRSARRRGLEGFVSVRFSVNPDGSTSGIETLRAEPGRTFISSAERAISRWRFAPRDDVVTTQITLNFSLEP